ncbi:hypothetical protein PQ478_08265 [Alkalihalophilus pseudofirmus]|uniref:hypothetical protein n=1 Tax=Alkalihalophilus pseudofirmus TaxID=79885 RepID=UPI00259BE271|nr:hypothetical protein [Alkalihalophilus pseudofirmus]WEG18463.1 hypothetical protein PQ478_08265 [Alkalihalophilus pseudofirmus]
MRKKKTHEEFVDEVYLCFKGEYEILSTYKNIKTKLKIKHKVCGEVDMITPKSLFERDCCAYCSGRKKSHNMFIKEIVDLVGNEYKVMDIYINSKTKVRIKHSVCDHEYAVKPNAFLSGSRCPKCKGKEISLKKRKSHENFVHELESKYGSEYQVLSEYTVSHEHVSMKHTTCGYEWEVVPNTFSRGLGSCPKCSNMYKRSLEDYLSEVQDQVQNEYTVLGEYISRDVKILMKHNSPECKNHEYFVSPAKFLSGQRCPKCKTISKGENRISKYLEANDISYLSQFKLNECRNVLPLPFDFAIFDKQGNLAFLIEYDGIQHFEPRDIWGGQASFIKTKRNDEIKTNYCLENNLKLIRIPYLDYNNIEEILDESLNINSNIPT